MTPRLSARCRSLSSPRPHRSAHVVVALRRGALLVVVLGLFACEGGPIRLPPAPGIGGSPTGGSGGLGNSLAASRACPSWTDNARHPQYPDEIWLTAVGVADLGESVTEARRLADERARQEIVFSIRARVQSMVEVRSRETSRSSEVQLDQLTQVVGAATLDGSEVVARCEDPARGVAYSLAALKRAVAARNLEAGIDETLSEANRVLEGALANPDRARALGPLLSSYDLFQSARLGQSTFRVLTGREFKKVEDRGNDARAALERLFSSLRLEVVEGQRQDASPGAPLEEEIAIRVVLTEGGRELPVPDLTLIFEPEAPGSIELSAPRARTGPDGVARFRAILVRATGREIGRVRVSVDVGTSGLGSPSTGVEYTLPTRETLDVLIVVDESNLGRAVSPSTIAVALGDHLKRAGFAVVDSGALVAQHGAARLLTAGRADLRRLVGARVDVVLRGTVEAIEADAGIGYPAARATATLSGIDLRSGQLLAALHAGPKLEASPRREDAGRNAIRLLARDVERGVVERLEAVLRGAGE